MTFDDATAKVGTYLRNNDLSNSDNNDRFFHIILNDLRQEYAPTVEMTKKQYEVWNVSLERSKKHKEDFIYFIDVLDDESSFQDNVFREKLEYFINDSKPLMQAWLYPETIKIVDE